MKNSPDTIAKKYGLAISLILAVVLLGPLLYNLFPPYFMAPDIQYVKAKVLRVLQGEIFADPITGFDNFHPPFYHLFLAPLEAIGIPIDYVLMLVIIFVVLCLFYFTFKIVEQQFDSTIALGTAMLVPFIVEYMGCGNLFLATAFYFAMPFYLAGLYYFLKPDRKTALTALYAILWGICFLVSPAYLFLIGLPMLYELIIKRDFRRFGIGFGLMMIVLIPFFYQAYVIFLQKLFGTSAFAFWRGIPDGAFFKDLILYILDPTEKPWSNPLVWAAGLVTVLGIIGIVKAKSQDTRLKDNRWFVIAAAIAYLLTFYHFKPQYAIRVHLFIALFLVPFAIYYIMVLTKSRTAIYLAVGLLFVAGFGYHFYRVNVEYTMQNELIPGYEQTRAQFKDAFPRFVQPDDYILAFHGTYRHYILPHYPVHALKAYDSGEYFQLTSKLSQEYEQDYQIALQCDTLPCLDYICNKYHIKIAVANAGDMKYPVFRLIDKSWQQVYADPYFRIYRRP